MKRNRKEELKKELLRLEMKKWDLRSSINNQALVKYDTPVPYGWHGFWVLRDDISRSPEAEILQYILDTYGVYTWSRRKDLKYRCPRLKKLVDMVPSFRNISESVYDELDSKVKKYFILDTSNKTKAWYRPTYKVDIPLWKLDTTSVKYYKTHYQEHDELLYQELNEVEFTILNITPAPWGSYNAPKWWRKVKRAESKTKNRIDDRNMIVAYNSGLDIDDIDTYADYCTSSWHYW